jgi:D-alanyl-lipoteichoic acid acyltransferase DltB (MBOAT superfamily)
VVISFFSAPKRFQTVLLLLASCYFYMAFVPQYILILFVLIIIDFFAAQAIGKRIGAERKKFLWLSIFANLGMLFVFKYFNFFNVNLASLSHFLHWNYSPLLLSIVLPLGLSFHIFQSLSYVIEVYRGKYPVEKNFLTYALYVMFFPQMVAGPIERPQHFLPQLKNHHQFDSFKARRGLERMLWGFFKKLVIADNLALVVNGLFGNLPNDGLSLIFLIILFSYQIYCDFSGYSDIAIGSALVLGYDLSENFNRPYASRSIGEFWRRWHISLSSWLRDYVYYSLVFSAKKKTQWKMYWALFITFLCSGLWHGANWTFVVWGALHGIYLVVGSATKKIRDSLSDYAHLSKFPKLHHTLQIMTVFILVSFSFIFFRSESIEQALQIISHLGNGVKSVFAFDGKTFELLKSNFDLAGKTQWVKYCMIVVMETVQYFQARKNTFYIFDIMPKAVRYLWYYVLIFTILIFGYFGKTAFIYFQF